MRLNRNIKKFNFKKKTIKVVRSNKKSNIKLNDFYRNLDLLPYNQSSCFFLGYDIPLAKRLQRKRFEPYANKNFLSLKLMELLRNRKH